MSRQIRSLCCEGRELCPLTDLGTEQHVSEKTIQQLNSLRQRRQQNVFADGVSVIASWSQPIQSGYSN